MPPATPKLLPRRQQKRRHPELGGLKMVLQYRRNYFLLWLFCIVMAGSFLVVTCLNLPNLPEEFHFLFVALIIGSVSLRPKKAEKLEFYEYGMLYKRKTVNQAYIYSDIKDIGLEHIDKPLNSLNIVKPNAQKPAQKSKIFAEIPTSQMLCTVEFSFVNQPGFKVDDECYEFLKNGMVILLQNLIWE